MCITVNILYYNRKFAERARSASGLMHILTWGMGVLQMILNSAMTSEIYAIFSLSLESFEPYHERHILVLSFVI